MKSASIFSILGVFIIFLSSCGGEKGSGNVIKVTRDLPEFNSIKLNGSFRVYIKQDTVQKVEVIADDNIAPIIETEVLNNTLTIDERDNRRIKRATLTDIYVSVPYLNNISIKGSGLISSSNTLVGDNLTLSIKGSGLMSIAFDGNNLHGSIDGSGQINLSGKGDYGSYAISGSGYFNAREFSVLNSDANISGSGNIELTVANTLNANISGSGHIGYSGAPIVQTNISGSGSVTKNW